MFKSIFPLFLLISAGVSCESLFRIDGQVTAENYNYYKLAQNGNILLVLDTIDGDADLYVNAKDETPPTYELDTYDLQSATCGIDTVYISKTFKRPLTVGIYGHFSYNQSTYTLDVHQMPDTHNYFDEKTVENPIVEKQQEPEEERPVKRAVKIKKKAKNVPNGLWPFLELFEIIFL